MRNRYLTAFLAAALAGLAGCAAANPHVRTVSEDNYNLYQLEAVPGPDGKPIPMGFDHPAAFPDEELVRVLESVQVVEPPGMLAALILKAKPEAETAFTPAEAAALAKPLGEALRTARPDERIRFFFHHQRSIYKGTTTSGIVFIKDQRLNLILGRYQLGNQPGKPDIIVGGNPLPPPNEQDFYLAAGPYQTLVPEDKLPGEKHKIGENRWVRIDYASLIHPPPAPQAAPAPAASPSPESTPPSLEEKLRTLNKLKEEGLITEEEYAEKKKDLLKSF